MPERSREAIHVGAPLVPVRLETRDGRHVVTMRLPPFVLWPEGVQWGNRTFYRHDDGQVPPVYREGLLWWAPPGAEARDQSRKAGPTREASDA